MPQKNLRQLEITILYVPTLHTGLSHSPGGDDIADPRAKIIPHYSLLATLAAFPALAITTFIQDGG